MVHLSRPASFMLPTILLAFALLATSTVLAQTSPTAECFPPCREGYLCHAGQCVSACNPPCAAGQLCTSQGQCVSACNPACLASELCSAAGQCVAASPTPAAPSAQPTPAVIAAPATPPPPGVAPAATGTPILNGPLPPSASDTGWARGAAVFGYVSAAATLALTGAVVATNDGDNGDTPRNIGIAATTLVIASGPIVAVGAASARNHPSVKGAPALRVISWIGYGLTIADASLLIALSFDEKISNGQILSVGALGALSTLGFALDANASANQAQAMHPATATAVGLSPIPRLAFASTGYGQRVPMLSWSGQF